MDIVLCSWRRYFYGEVNLQSWNKSEKLQIKALDVFHSQSTTTTITSQLSFYYALQLPSTFVCTKVEILKTSLCVVIGDVVQQEYS